MAYSGQEAAKLLAGIASRVELFRKDNTDKFWCYKLRGAKRTEFAFDPRTTNGLHVRVDRAPPTLLGVLDVEVIRGKNISTALDRVFSGGIHGAFYKVTIESEAALLDFIAHYEAL